MRNRLLWLALLLLLPAALMLPVFGQGESVVGVLDDAPRSYLQEAPYLTQCELGCTVADAVREAAGTQIALVNWGDIQNDLNQGTVNASQISRVFSQDRPLATATVTPAALYGMLEHAVSQIQVDPATEQVAEGTEAFDGFCQVSGLFLRYDASAPVGARVMEITLEDGRTLSPEDGTTVLTLAATEYMLTGGYGFAPVDCTPLNFSLSDALADYVSLCRALPEGETERITLIGARNNLIAGRFPRGLLISGLVLLTLFLGVTGIRAKSRREL